MTDYRLFVTGNTEAQKSSFISTSTIHVNNFFEYQPGFSVEVFWRTAATTTVGGEFQQPIVNPSTILPEPAGSTAMIVTFPSQHQQPEPEPLLLEKIIQETFEKLPGLAETFESEPPGYHLTNTIDYVLVLEGKVNLLLDLDQAELKTGDIVVQNGTRHAWVNDSGAPVRLLVMMVGVNRVLK